MKVQLSSILVWLIVLLSVPISFINTDLPRHLLNGKIITSTFSIPTSNTYSYTYPDFFAPMHHWGYGVIVYFIDSIVGSVGLHLFQICLICISLLILVHLSLINTQNKFTVAIALLVLTPIIGSRPEVRPESFTVLFAAIFIYINWRVYSENLSKNWLWILVLFQILWVNIHVQFIFGWILTAIFAVSFSLTHRTIWDNVHAKLLIGLFLISLINPFGYQGLLTPFQVMTPAQQLVTENFTLLKYARLFPNFMSYWVIFIVILTIVLFAKFSRNLLVAKQFPILGLGILACGLGLFMTRQVQLMALVLIPVLSCLLSNLNFSKYVNFTKYLSLIIVLAIVYTVNYRWNHHQIGWGIEDNHLEAGKFLIQENISGPVLNNFNSGGYIAYFMYPNEKVFIDARAEAYPDEFVSKMYAKLDTDPKIFDQFDKQYNFNFVFSEIAAQSIEWPNLLSRLKNDRNWALIYKDKDAVIFAKRNPVNQSIIERNEITLN